MAFALTALMGIALLRFPAHLADTQWPAHAKAHLVSQIAVVVGLGLTGLAILFGPFRRGRAWAWWCLLVSGLALFGGYWLALAVAEPGLAWRSTHSLFAVLSALYTGGLALGWRHCTPVGNGG